MSRTAVFVIGVSALVAGIRCSAPVSAGGSAELAQLRATGNALFTRGDMPGAAAVYERGFRLASAAGDTRLAGRFLNNSSGARLALFQFRTAISAAMQARDLAESEGDTQTIVAACSNLSSMHAQMGDSDAAVRWAEEALHRLGSSDPWGSRGQVEALYADQLTSTGRVSEALPRYQDALRAANRRGDMRIVAQLWDHYGDALLTAQRPADAEVALTRSFYLRTVLHLPGLQQSLLNLSRLRLMQGDAASALALAEHAAVIDESSYLAPPWSIPWTRAQAELGLNRRRESRANLRAAIAALREWGTGLAPADGIRARAGREFQRIYDQLIEEDMSARPRFSAEAFQLSEQSRASSMRQTLALCPEWKSKLPDEYWRLLAQIRNELSAPGAPVATMALARVRLRELEAATIAKHIPVKSTPGERTTPQETLTGIRRKLGPDEAFLSFHLGTRSSWRWVVTRSRFASQRLPLNADLPGLIRRWRVAVQDSTPERDELGRRLYRLLFGHVGGEIESRTSWVIACDDEIFEIPFSALVVNSSGPPIYLVERHATRVIPGVLLATARENSPPPGLDGFVGIGDGIYNSADERFVGGPLFMTAASMSARPPRELPRLPASGTELRSAAAAWNGSPSLLLTGARASRKNLLSALTARPAVVHIATHVLHATASADDAVLDFGRDENGASEVVAVEDIASLDLPQSTVVMSGCASAAGSSAAGAGFLGLTRAWFLAGARAVVGSKWVTADDTGALFTSFYRHFRNTSRAARRGAAGRAMQLARLDMLHSRSWHAVPAYWAAFDVVEKE